ncbi:hypothetical protein [Bradyrhizobium sp. Y36]|uniref:hypothetical protein n=1 Tax=Bradyrhizobium sp. Y36 TaxID=2035447 RepID=UPI0011777C6E|nr:hypothetical protein [Bradyrhizobium sp. Y36]
MADQSSQNRYDCIRTLNEDVSDLCSHVSLATTNGRGPLTELMPRGLLFAAHPRTERAIIAVTSLVSGDQDWLKQRDPVILLPDVKIFPAYFA